MSTINKIEVSGVTYDIEDSTARSQSGLTDEAKQALLACFQNVAWINASGQTYYDALETALYPPANLSSISAVYTQSGTVYNTDSLDSLKADLVVTAHYSDSTTATVTNYVLSGTLTVGTSTITVAYGGKTTTFSVTVTDDPYLYKLASQFASDGTNKVDTGVTFEKNKTYTFLCDHMPTTISGSTVSYVYGDKVSGDNNYLALQVNNKGMWGCGISYNSRVTAATNVRFRTAAVCTIDSSGHASVAISLKNITNAAEIQAFSNSYDSYDYSSILNPICLGDAEGASTGFIGTVYDFKIYDGEMASADITDYLNNGA